MADILYLHGFADHLGNHRQLFEAWTNAGFRVIAFDFPSHGKSYGLRGLDTFPFTSLARLAATIEKRTAEDSRRPLLLAGWSTGALLATRIVSSNQFPRFTRPIKAQILFSPGISVPWLVGDFGRVTWRSLSNNPALWNSPAPKPMSPFVKPLFSLSLKLNSWVAQSDLLSVPTLCMVGGVDDNRYINLNNVIDWAAWQEASGMPLELREFPDAAHALDLEWGTIGPSVREAAVNFALDQVRARTR